MKIIEIESPDEEANMNQEDRSRESPRCGSPRRHHGHHCERENQGRGFSSQHHHGHGGHQGQCPRHHGFDRFDHRGPFSHHHGQFNRFDHRGPFPHHPHHQGRFGFGPNGDFPHHFGQFPHHHEHFGCQHRGPSMHHHRFHGPQERLFRFSEHFREQFAS